MFDDLAKLVPKDKDLPDRAHSIAVLTRVLDGEIYDALPYSFHEEKNGAGEYVPLAQRKPSVRTGIIKTVVDDSVSLLFSEGHFPQIQCDDEGTVDALKTIIKDAQINVAMIDAATRGSVGSVVVLVRFLSSRVFVSVVSSQYMTPTYDPMEPDKLLKVTSRYKVTGQQLRDSGYTVKDDEHAAKFWFQVEWNRQKEVWYVPVLCSSDKQTLREDTRRTVAHGLGFVPAVWVRNLPGGNGVDGAATFGKEAINTVIEADYQLSQAGRGLRYSADPTLLLKEPAMGEGSLVRGAANAVVVGAEGDAKLLEISGSASAAVIEYVKTLRELAIESMHGNRSNADKLSAAQSGRALEMLHQSLIWLADKLRASYGEHALLEIYQMIVAGSQRNPIQIRGVDCKMNAGATIALVWPAWFPPTATDRASLAGALKTQIDAGVMSQETAVKTIADDYDIEDVPAELVLIEADRVKRIADMPPAAAKLTDAVD